jgi:hypothetical protein
MARNIGHVRNSSTQIPDGKILCACSKMATISFCKELDNLTTADFYSVSNQKKKRKLDYGEIISP